MLQNIVITRWMLKIQIIADINVGMSLQSSVVLYACLQCVCPSVCKYVSVCLSVCLGAQPMSVSHPHQLLRQLSQPTDSSSTSAWLSQSSPVPAAAAAPMSSSSSSSSSWPGQSAAAAAATEMPVLIQQTAVNIKQQPQDTPTDSFQPQIAGNSAFVEVLG